MRLGVFVSMGLAFLLAGCAAGLKGWEAPGEEAIYDAPLEEVWPSVRQFFTDNGLSFREDKGNFVLETEWRQEFGGSRVAGYWHRYLVLGKRETPVRSKLWITRVTRTANRTLARAGDELDWGVDRGLGGGNGEASSDGLEWYQSAEDLVDMGEMPRGENGIVAGSAQGSRDLMMEWKVYEALAPRLAKREASAAEGAQAPEVKAAPVAALAVECGQPIAGLAAQVKPGGVLLLGELHGTQEVPRFIAQSACQAAANGTPVTVGLELPVVQQERVATFLRSAGTEDDWLKLMEAPFWRNPYQDGRSSEAMANLLEQLRQLRARGLDVDVFVFDHPGSKGQAHEDAMAATVLSHVRQAQGRFFLVVSGNIHPRTVQGLPWDASHKPMGLLLTAQLKNVVALDMAYNSGSAWICAAEASNQRLECGVRPARGKDNGDRFFVHLFERPNKDGYHGIFYVGPVTASIPAVNRGLGRPGAGADASPPPEG
ncbi:ChaN family lipoprotein [Archangium minus]|uniref:ChaN family lipoprotein n=1 Tax=Archangium minus TaxID=83450 RepID=A0ABY9X878_9BACT|nr:ChaN family lipoprotein [Archangium minus]